MNNTVRIYFSQNHRPKTLDFEIIHPSINYVSSSNIKLINKQYFEKQINRWLVNDYHEVSDEFKIRLLVLLEKICEHKKELIKYIPSLNIEFRLKYVDKNENIFSIPIKLYENGRYIFNFIMNDEIIIGKAFDLIYNLFRMRSECIDTIDDKYIIENLQKLEENYNKEAAQSVGYMTIF